MRNYLLHFFLVVLTILLPALFFAWWAEPIYGDLTRIGKWTEHDFGSNATHPAIQVKASSRSLVNPDVVVLGDSFTAPNLWQSVLSDSTGHVVKSFQYGKNCIANWVEAAVAEPAYKIIIIETVERGFISSFSRISLCSRAEPVPSEVPAGINANRRPTWPPTLSLSYLIPTAINTGALNIFPEKDSNRFLVVNTPLRAGCALFSNRRNDRLLYYAEDDLKLQWKAQEIQDAVANVLKIQEKVKRSGKEFVFVLAPDKSSIYQDCLLGNKAKSVPNINKILIASGVHTPDLQAVFRENINTIADLYDPDNTHWSEAGYILAGNEIGKYLSRHNLLSTDEQISHSLGKY